MDIETFVQRYYLERILHAANLRFQEMSGGQFELRIIDEALWQKVQERLKSTANSGKGRRSDLAKGNKAKDGFWTEPLEVTWTGWKFVKEW